MTGNAVRAGGWADRAPEATWDALWSVYRVRHAEVGWGWTTPQGHLWVLAQRLYDPSGEAEETFNEQLRGLLGRARPERGSHRLGSLTRIVGWDRGSRYSASTTLAIV